MHPIDQNFTRHAAFIPSLTFSMEVHQKEELVYVDSGLSCDTFNLIHVFSGNEEAARLLREAVTHFREVQRDFCVWIRDEYQTPILQQTLASLGTTEQGSEVAMMLDLANYHPMLPNDRATIQQVQSPAQLRDYAHVLAHNWTPPDSHVIHYYEQTATHYLNPAHRIGLYVYYQENIPVATVELFPTDDHTVGIYGLATLAAYRGRGIGSALFTYVLHRAKEQGFRQIILQASADGIGIYRRMGFVEHGVYSEWG
jgi:ribosomal protein S18 acetylase RimI-like enzyme